MDRVVLPGRRTKRPNFPIEFKKGLAQQACEPGVSVSQLAQQHGVNVNMLFKWRRHLVAGLFDVSSNPPAQLMLPVTIIDSVVSVPQQVTRVKAKRQAVAPSVAPAAMSRPSGGMELQIADATIRFDGHVDLAVLRSIVRILRP